MISLFSYCAHWAILSRDPVLHFFRHGREWNRRRFPGSCGSPDGEADPSGAFPIGHVFWVDPACGRFFKMLKFAQVSHFLPSSVECGRKGFQALVISLVIVVTDKHINLRFNGTLRKEVLNAEWFASIDQAKTVIGK